MKTIVELVIYLQLVSLLKHVSKTNQVNGYHLEHNNSLNELSQYPIIENSFLSSPIIISTPTTSKSNNSKTTSPILASASTANNFNQISNDLIHFPLNDSNDDHHFFDELSRLTSNALHQQQIISNLASINNNSIVQKSNNQQQK